ncbi:ApeP family dehydratase [Nannocystis bainbridge]|uniref:3-hydroxylacyl-ACP dehydratase n=1 Tax=Nannocystis bainbridge TaxID=2995303 RepID=A0ABT5E7T6_9BACT|nr:hypothetical protein [Nannocystis bainbridge]MDC0721932.1 hypothetical protein [Nannocystis bainbridge]
MAFPPLDEILPHRPPMLLLDALTAAEAESATCRATVRAGAPFVVGERVSSLIALEYFAQTVAALFAYKARSGAGGPFRGLLLGARDLELAASHLRVGDVLDVHCREQWASGPVAQFHCTLNRGGEQLATGAVTVLRGDPAEFAAGGSDLSPGTAASDLSSGTSSLSSTPASDLSLGTSAGEPSVTRLDLVEPAP